MRNALRIAAALTLAAGCTVSLAATTVAEPQVETGLSITDAEAAELLNAYATQKAELGVGDDAPELFVAEWIQGQPVTGFESGHTYVVEMWATWCGPCIAAIPHLAELSEQYEDDATFIGMNIFENIPDDQRAEAIREFIKNNPQMTYTVAYEDNQGMANNWMRPAGKNGIPSSFIINQEGKIAWIGHPMQMDAPLASVVAGDWDLEEAVRKDAISQRAQLAMQDGMQKIAAGDEEGFKLLEAVGITAYPDMPKYFAAMADQATSSSIAKPNFAWAERMLNYAGEQSEWKDGSIVLAKAQLKWKMGEEAEAERLFWDGLELIDDANTLNSIAWGMATDGENPDPKMIEMAVAVAEKAVKLSERTNADILDTLARAYWEAGRNQDAINAQQEAVNTAPNDQAKGNYNKRLEQYKSETKSEG